MAVERMMPLTSDAPEVTQETKNRAESTKSDRVNSNLERKLHSIEARPTEVEGSEKRELVVEDAGVRTMGSPKVDAVAGDAGSKGTPPDKVASSSSSSCKGGLDSGGSPAAPAIKSGSGSTRGDEGVPEGSPDVAGPPAESSSSAAPSVASHGGGSGGPRWDEDILHLLDDLEGVELFKRYLEQEQLGHYLLFYHFCQGFKETVESPAKLRKIVRMAHRDFIVGGATVGKPSKFIECLNQDVRSAIGDVVRNPSDAIDMHMFDAAQQQVLDFMRRTSYIKFFESDVYIQWLQTRDSSSSKPHSSASSVSGRQGGTESAIDQGQGLGWRLDRQTMEYGQLAITIIHDRTFFLNFLKRDHIEMLWVTLLGTEEEAKTFEVKMTAGTHDTLISMRSKVYSIDKRKEEVLQEHGGVMEVSKNMADKMGRMEDGKFMLHVKYYITLKPE